MKKKILALIAVVILAILAFSLYNVLFRSCCGVGVMCASSDPANIVVYAYDIDFTGVLDSEEPLGKIWAQNKTGEDIQVVGAIGNGAFANEVRFVCTGEKEFDVYNQPSGIECPANVVEDGEFFLLTPYASSLGTHPGTRIELSYIGSKGNTKTATITCPGTMTIYENTPLGRAQSDAENQRISCCW